MGEAIFCGDERYVGMKKRLALTLVLVGCWVAANAQMSEVNDCLRFLPSRMANHIRTVKAYRLSTEAAGARRLVATTRYDRQGYKTYHRQGSEMPDSIECTYDSLNRLVQWKRAECRWDNDSQRMVWSSLFIENLDYTPDGLVSLVQTFTYDRVNSKIDTTVIIYRLIRLECSDRGVTACNYAYYERESSHGMKEEQTDTCLFRREYDTEGHLLHQTYTDEVGSRGLDNYEERYAYDRQGRVLYKISCSYGGCDSLAYRYGAQGNVVEMSGKSWVQGIESDVIVRFSPDGFPLERTEISYPPEGDESAERSVTRTWYDAKGGVVREEKTDYTTEYEVEYWED